MIQMDSGVARGGQGRARALGRRAKGGAKRGGEKKTKKFNKKINFFLKKIALLQKFFAAHRS